MIQLKKFDKILLVLGILIVIGLFTLSYVLLVKGGQCAVDPIKYALENNLTNPNIYPYFVP